MGNLKIKKYVSIFWVLNGVLVGNIVLNNYSFKKNLIFASSNNSYKININLNFSKPEEAFDRLEATVFQHICDIDNFNDSSTKEHVRTVWVNFFNSLYDTFTALMFHFEKNKFNFKNTKFNFFKEFDYKFRDLYEKIKLLISNNAIYTQLGIKQELEETLARLNNKVVQPSILNLKKIFFNYIQTYNSVFIKTLHELYNLSWQMNKFGVDNNYKHFCVLFYEFIDLIENCGVNFSNVIGFSDNKNMIINWKNWCSYKNIRRLMLKWFYVNDFLKEQLCSINDNNIFDKQFKNKITNKIKTSINIRNKLVGDIKPQATTLRLQSIEGELEDILIMMLNQQSSNGFTIDEFNQFTFNNIYKIETILNNIHINKNIYYCDKDDKEYLFFLLEQFYKQIEIVMEQFKETSFNKDAFKTLIEKTKSSLKTIDNICKNKIKPNSMLISKVGYNHDKFDEIMKTLQEINQQSYFDYCFSNLNEKRVLQYLSKINLISKDLFKLLGETRFVLNFYNCYNVLNDIFNRFRSVVDFDFIEKNIDICQPIFDLICLSKYFCFEGTNLEDLCNIAEKTKEEIKNVCLKDENKLIQLMNYVKILIFYIETSERRNLIKDDIQYKNYVQFLNFLIGINQDSKNENILYYVKLIDELCKKSKIIKNQGLLVSLEQIQEQLLNLKIYFNQYPPLVGYLQKL